MRFVLRYMSAYKKESIMAPLFKMLEAIFELLVHFVVAAIIDNGIMTANYGYIVKMALLMIVIAIIGALFALTAQYFAAKTATGVAYNVRYDLSEAILNMDKNRFRQIGKSTLLTRMTSDVNALQNALNMFLRLFLRSPFIVIGAFIMSMLIDVRMSLIIGGVIVVLACLIFVVMRVTFPRINTIQTRVDGINRRVGNDYAGAKVIRGFVIQDDENEKFSEQIDELYARQIGVGRLSNILNPLTFALVNLGIILILYFGGINVQIGNLTTGEVVALLNYMSQILVELVKLANLIVILIKGIPSAKRLKSVIDEPTMGNVDASKEESVAPIVDRVRGIRDSELNSIAKEEKVGVIGPTGCGKSLLLSLYMDSVEDKSVVGFVPQEDSFFTGTIAENILLKEYTDRDADVDNDMQEALNMSGFKQVVDIKGGINEPIIKNANNLSTGQKKRLALARALYKKPKLLLMDDVTNPLDMITELDVIDNVLRSEMAVIIASQKVSAVMRCDRIIVIDNGKVVDTGTHSELLERCELYSKMYYAQYPKEAEQV